MTAEKHRKGKKEFRQYVWTCLTPTLCLADQFPNNCERSRSLLHHPLECKSSWDIAEDWTSLRKSYSKSMYKQSCLFQQFKVKSKEVSSKRQILLGLPALSQDSDSPGMDGATDGKLSSACS